MLIYGVEKVKKKERKMNFKKHYDLLCERARNRNKLTCYIERHHVLPRCMGGTDDEANIIELTPEEHYVAHQLLVKMHPDHSGLVYAALAMSMSNDYHHRSTNKLYGWLRKKCSELMSGTVIITNGTTNKYIKPEQPIPNGWYLGRHHSCNKGMFRITDGENNKMINSHECLPEGWWFGLARNHFVITNGKENQSIKKNGEIPEGWRLGMTGKQGLATKGRIGYTNGVKNILIEPNETPPEGFWKGAINLHKKGNRIWINNGKRNAKHLKSKPIPEGWVIGQTEIEGRDAVKDKIWITNGKRNKAISPNDPIPNGWYIGSTQKKDNRIRITNGKENARVDSEKDIPEGWRRGVTQFKKGK